ncbi:hypothetical protein GcC1_064024 [Golovinomyces cichoracearum]|uniref:Uncharacterized protein n=1 Tax=Golovinomyces cichoracearum TaxID=62708 RepID=A0A420ISC0_9PEZI|nr:hypothetical protein GcC1_064024 [Golovinomyces cichoracearum]
MLLRSSEVSVAVFSGTAFLFTFALFLSGCFLQRQTIVELRGIINPQHFSQRGLSGQDINLPSQFRDKRYWTGRENIDVLSGMKMDETSASDKSRENTKLDYIYGAIRWRGRKHKEKNKVPKGAAVNSLSSMTRVERRKLIKSQLLAE